MATLTDDQAKQLDSLAGAVAIAHTATDAAQSDNNDKHTAASTADAAAAVSDASLATAKRAESDAISALLMFLQGLGVTPNLATFLSSRKTGGCCG